MSRVLSVMLSHLPAEATEQRVAWLKRTCPDIDLLLAYSGPQEEFDRLSHTQRIPIRHPRPVVEDYQRERQSYAGLLRAVAEWIRGSDHTHILLIEYDHPLVHHDAVSLWLRYLEERKADVVGFHVRRIDGTNCPHYLYHEAGNSLTAYLRNVSVRADKEVVLTMLGTGSMWTREALVATAAMEEPFPVYLELWIPTMAHHLGYRVVEVPAEQLRWVTSLGDLVEMLPEARAAGAWSLHPVKSMPTQTFSR